MASQKPSLSHLQLDIAEIEQYFLSTEKALLSFYRRTNFEFALYSPQELERERQERLEELNKSTSLTILAAVEAHIMVNFVNRCLNREKDPLSKKFRTLFKNKGHEVQKISLRNDILGLWKDHVNHKWVVSELRAAIRYRHWLAHGRYFTD